MKILFISATNLGDAVLTSGALHKLISLYPDAQISVACGPVATSIFEQIPQVKNVIPIQKKKYAGHWLLLMRQTLFTHWDIVADLRNSLVSRFYFAKKKYIWSQHDQIHHKVEQIARAFGWEDDPPAPHFFINDITRAKVSSLIPSEPFIVLGPTAKWPGKMWPAEYFVSFAQQMTAIPPLKNAKIVVIAAKGEEKDACKVLSAIPAAQAVDLIAKLTLPEIAAVIEKSALYVGNDSGLTHVAAATGAKTLGLFGYGWPALYRPWGKNAAFVATPESPEDLIAPHQHDINGVTESLMRSLTVDMALNGARQLLQK